MKPDDVRILLKSYDDGKLNEHTFNLLLAQGCNDSILAYLRAQQDPIVSFTGGTFAGPLKHDYGMFDVDAQTSAYYRFTFINVIRFYWNKLMRAVGLHKLTKVW